MSNHRYFHFESIAHSTHLENITLEVQTPHQILFLFGRSFVVVNVIGFQFAYIKLKSPFFLVVAGGWKHHWQERRDRETLSRRGKKLGNASIENWEVPNCVCVKLSSNDIQKLPRALQSTHLSFFKVSLFTLTLAGKKAAIEKSKNQWV